MDLRNGTEVRYGLAHVLAGYNVFAAIAWILRDTGVLGLPMAGLHLLCAVVVLGLGGRLVLVPMAWGSWLLAWMELGWLYRISAPAVHDEAVVAFERALLGGHLHETLAAALSWKPLATVMGAAYLSYYLLILGPPIVLALRRRTRELADHTLGVVATYLACFTVYLAYPVLGPRAWQAAAGDPVTGGGGLVDAVMHGLFAAGDSLGTAFPSSHCAASVAAALMVARHFGPRAGRVAGVWAGCIVISTVYTANHYAVDALAGILLALASAVFIRAWLSGRTPAPALGRPGRPRLDGEGGRS